MEERSDARDDHTPSRRLRMTTSREDPSPDGAVDGRDGASQAYSAASRISTDMVQLMSRYTGRGPTKARAVINPGFVLVVLDDALTKGERSLVAAGELEAVRSQRRTFHELMRAEATARVEAVSGRRVSAALHDIAPEQGVAVVIFLLEPPGEASLSIVPEDGSGL
jgi:uncharacterized protein YbcI